MTLQFLEDTEVEQLKIGDVSKEVDKVPDMDVSRTDSLPSRLGSRDVYYSSGGVTSNALTAFAAIYEVICNEAEKMKKLESNTSELLRHQLDIFRLSIV
ncbi:hypothetical protein ACH5RR_013695 [Cinchona calisaya]|uniref:Uncharacterized protein n=1 Tax=Cinchona calisaya TaxID=153742 RepID=A0ABD3A266_9GENT